MKLDILLKNLPEISKPISPNSEITGITEDSRRVKKGDLFVAVKGLTVDGHNYIQDAILSGARAVVGQLDKSKVKITSKTPYVKVKNSRSALGILASTFFNDPSQKLKVIGVTGTDGKTTTANLLYHIFVSCDKKVGLISTISAKIGKKEIDTGFHVTNPDPVSLQKLLKTMVREKCEFAVIEVTSHGLDQERVAGVTFDSAVLTNITHEHLDYHKTWESYRDAKAELFRLARSFIVLNKDDSSFSYISGKASSGVQIFSYSLFPDATSLYAQNIKYMEEGMEFDIFDGVAALNCKSSLMGSYNVANILAATTCARQYNLDLKDIKKAIETFKPPVGRLEKINTKKGFTIYVDFVTLQMPLKVS